VVNVNGDTDLWRTASTVNIEGTRVRKKDAREDVKMLFYFYNMASSQARSTDWIAMTLPMKVVMCEDAC